MVFLHSISIVFARVDMQLQEVSVSDLEYQSMAYMKPLGICSSQCTINEHVLQSINERAGGDPHTFASYDKVVHSSQK